MPYPRPYRAGPIQPVVEVGQNLLLEDRMQFYLYQVGFIEPIPPSHPMVVSIGAIAAGVTSAIFNPTAALDMEDGQVAQLRCRVLDDIVLTVLQPQSSTRFTLRNQQARITVFTPLYDEHDAITEMWLFAQDRPFFQAVNPTGYNLAQARVAFYGYKYVLWGPGGPAQGPGQLGYIRKFTSIKEATDSGERFTVVPAGGWGR